MKRIVLIICIALSSLTSHAQRAMVHPGGPQSLEELEFLKSKVLAKEKPWISAWNLMANTNRARSNYATTGSASGDIGGSDGTRQKASRDAQAAYYNILQWYVYKDNDPAGAKAHADCAVNILNMWARSITRQANDELFQLPIISMVEAAELTRLYEGWSEADQEHFKKVCLDYWYPGCKKFLGHEGSWPGWDGPANLCNLMIGVFCDRADLYEEALRYYQYGNAVTGMGGGRLTNMVFRENGQSVEMGRDMPHAEIGPDAAAEFCEIAWSQGDDMWSLADNRLLACYEYLNRYHLEHEADYVEYNDSANKHLYDVSINSPFRITGFPGEEAAFNHYVLRKGLSAPYTSQYVKLRGVQSHGWDAANHTVLTYLNQSVGNHYDKLDVPAAPEHLQAIAGINSVRLTWTRPNWRLVSGSIIQRSEDGKSWATVYTYNNNTSTEFVDSPLAGAKPYHYRVALKNNDGVGAYCRAVKATPSRGEALPAGWKLSDVGSVEKAGEAVWYEGADRSMTLASRAYAMGGNQTVDNFTYAYQKVSGSYTLIVHIPGYNRCDKQADIFGIMIRESLGDGARMVALGQNAVGSRYTYMMARTAANSKLAYYGGNTFTSPGAWLKLVREGAKFTAYQCYDGAHWHQIHSTTITGFANKCYVGLFASRGWNGATGETKVWFDHITFQNTALGTVCEQPKNFTATTTATTAFLTWNKTADARNYTMLRSNAENGPYVNVADVLTDTTFTDADLEPGRTYYYRLSAKNLTGESAGDTIALTTRELTLPERPQHLKATSVGTHAYIDWDFDDNATSYTILRSSAESGEYKVAHKLAVAHLKNDGQGRMGYEDPNTVTSGTYFYKVMAANALGESEAAGPVAITVALQHRLTGSWSSTDEGTSSHPLAYATDMNPTTSYESGVSAPVITLDLGPGHEAQVTQLRYVPRTGHTANMLGGVFEASATASFEEPVVLHRISEEPKANVWTKQMVYNTHAYRYLRYVAPALSYGNVAEIQFYGSAHSADGIIAVEGQAPTTVGYFTVDGCQTRWLHRGVNIVRDKQGIRKIVVR